MVLFKYRFGVFLLPVYCTCTAAPLSALCNQLAVHCVTSLSRAVLSELCRNCNHVEMGIYDIVQSAVIEGGGHMGARNCGMARESHLTLSAGTSMGFSPMSLPSTAGKQECTSTYRSSLSFPRPSTKYASTSLTST